MNGRHLRPPPLAKPALLGSTLLSAKPPGLLPSKPWSPDSCPAPRAASWLLCFHAPLHIVPNTMDPQGLQIQLCSLLPLAWNPQPSVSPALPAGPTPAPGRRLKSLEVLCPYHLPALHKATSRLPLEGLRILLTLQEPCPRFWHPSLLITVPPWASFALSDGPHSSFALRH